MACNKLTNFFVVVYIITIVVYYAKVCMFIQLDAPSLSPFSLWY